MLFYVPDLHQAWLRGLHAWELTESLAKLQEVFSFPLCRWGMSLQKSQYLSLSDTELRSSTPSLKPQWLGSGTSPLPQQAELWDL